MSFSACNGDSTNNQQTPSNGIVEPVEPLEPVSTEEFSTPTHNTPPLLAPDNRPTENLYKGNVTVSIRLTVPDNTPIADNLYLSGDFENWSGGGNPEFALLPQQDGSYTTQLEFDAGLSLQFKVTRGNWGKEEVSEIGRSIANRIVNLRDKDVHLDITVQNWNDLSDSIPNPYAGYWQTPTPDYSTNNERPVINLRGAQTVLVDLHQDYQEVGATALDPQDGDISGQIIIEGSVDTTQVGDYILRYRVSDSQQNSSIGVSRLVRVQNQQAVNFSLRPVGSTHSHLGYVEQLPAEYGTDPRIKYPVLLYHHGGGGDASSVNNTPTEALTTLFTIGGGPALLAMTGNWNTASPLIVLSPQRSVFSPPNFERIDAFVDYAVANYQIDPNRVYMTGHSQGGFVSWRYATDYFNKVAAIAPIAGGFFAGGIPSYICQAAVVPIWAFHSIDDNIVSAAAGRQPIDKLNDCQNIGVQPRFTTFNGLGHQSHQYVLSLQGMGNALSTDDLFDENLYSWMLNQSLLNR